MKMYRVNVNGNVYDITLEVIDQAEAKVPPTPVAPTPSVSPDPTPTVTSAGGEKINAPMPGTILSVNVANGSSVKKGDVLVVLEAMKMENEIMAPCDGTVTGLTVTKGASVEAGAMICTLN